MKRAHLGMAAIVAIAAASLALPPMSVAQAAQSKAQMQTSSKYKKQASGKHKKQHMAHSAKHKKLYGSMRPPTKEQMKGTGTGVGPQTAPNGPNETNPSGVK